MRTEDGELDYLVGTQLETDPGAFAQVVKEAFLLEHDCIENQDIAEVLGVDKSRVSQKFGKPETLKPETIHKLLNHLSKAAHRRAVVRAWVNECFGEDINKAPGGELTGGNVTVKTLRRIDRQIRQSRLAEAAQTAQEAATKASDWELRQQFLDRAYFARQRLDEPGQAMTVARMVAEGASDRRDFLRLAAAHTMRFRILLGLTDSRPEDFIQISGRIRDLLGASRKPSDKPTYLIGDLETLASLELSATLTLMERRIISPVEADLRQMLSDVQTNLKRKLAQPSRFQAEIVAARLHLMLGETFQAQEHIDQAFKSGALKNLHVYEMCGILQGRVLARTESVVHASDYLQGVISNCRKSVDGYHQRLAEYDLARMESSAFPG